MRSRHSCPACWPTHRKEGSPVCIRTYAHTPPRATSHPGHPPRTASCRSGAACLAGGRAQGRRGCSALDWPPPGHGAVGGERVAWEGAVGAEPSTEPSAEQPGRSGQRSRAGHRAALLTSRLMEPSRWHKSTAPRTSLRHTAVGGGGGFGRQGAVSTQQRRARRRRSAAVHSARSAGACRRHSCPCRACRCRRTACP